MALQIVSPTVPANIAEVDTNKALRVDLYDAAGNLITRTDKSAIPASLGYVPTMGLDGGVILRAVRVGEYGTQRTTSEILLLHDAFEGATVNTFAWTQSTATMTIVQATGVLTLNNAAITTLNTDAIITSVKQHPKYPRQPLYCRFRAKLSTVVPVHSLAEMGFGAPAGVTAIVSNGAFFRFKANGTLAGIISYNGTEQETIFASTPNATSYYDYDVIVDDDFVRFIVQDAAGTPIVDQQVALTLTVPFNFAVSHVPTFARVYVDGVGGGVAMQLLIAAHTTQMIDAANNKPWHHQLSACGRQAIINPTSYAQTTQLASGAAPAAFTPSNTVGGNAFLGGEALCNATATSENLLSVFAFVITSPYTFFLTDIFIGTPLNTVVAVATTATVLEWALIANCATGNISTGGGQRMTIPNATFTAAVALAANALFSGAPAFYSPRTPIICLPGTTLHIAYKVIIGTATATEVYRNNIAVGGYFQ